MTDLFHALLALAAILLPLFLAWALLVWHAMARPSAGPRATGAAQDDAPDRRGSS